MTNIYLDLAERSRQEHSEIKWEKPACRLVKKTREFYRVNA